MSDQRSGAFSSALEPKRQWTMSEAQASFEQTVSDLIFQAQMALRRHFDANRVQLSKLLNIKTGGCPEDCGYCSQSSHHAAGVAASRLMTVQEVLEEAQKAKEGGVGRYCMGAAWRSVKARDVATVVAMVKGVKALGLETCMTLGMLSSDQAQTLADAGLDYYNHNIDTSERFYPEVVTTHTFNERMQTLTHVRHAGIKVCCGGILGMGESIDDRIAMLVTLANLPTPPESVPLNLLIPISGTRLAKAKPIEPFAFVRIVALARLMMPQSYVRLAAGRAAMSDELQALCFLAGANSIFVGDTLLTAPNPAQARDFTLLGRLGMAPETGGRSDSDARTSPGTVR